MRKVTPPVVCQARTLPIDCPLALRRGIGGPPAGSTGAQPGKANGAARVAAMATVRGSVPRMEVKR